MPVGFCGRCCEGVVVADRVMGWSRRGGGAGWRGPGLGHLITWPKSNYVAQAGLRQGELGGASPCLLIDWAPSLQELLTASQAATAEPPDLYGVTLVCGVAEVHAVIQQTLHQKPLPHPKTLVQMNAFSRERRTVMTFMRSVD
jgi:hypothetical protein